MRFCGARAIAEPLSRTSCVRGPGQALFYCARADSRNWPQVAVVWLGSLALHLRRWFPMRQGRINTAGHRSASVDPDPAHTCVFAVRRAPIARFRREHCLGAWARPISPSLGGFATIFAASGKIAPNPTHGPRFPRFRPAVTTTRPERFWAPSESAPNDSEPSRTILNHSEPFFSPA